MTRTAHLASTWLRSAALATAFVLASCSGGNEGDLNSLDNQIIANDADPALTSALEDQIMVDPALSQQSNRNSVRPPATPTQAQYPAPTPQGSGSSPAETAQARLARDTGHGGEVRRAGGQVPAGGACGGGEHFDYNAAWANRLPPPFAVYPGARITEAAGNDNGGCRMRVVTFLVRQPWQRIVDWYHVRAVRGGYSSERQVRGSDHVLGGYSEQSDGAFYLIVTPRSDGGSEVALITNSGR